RVMQRFWLVPRIENRVDSDQLRLIRGEEVEPDRDPFDPRAAALVHAEDAASDELSMLLSNRNGKNDPVISDQGVKPTLVISEPGSMTITAEVPRPMMLVMSDVFYPGWHARIDSQEATLWRVNYILRGVALPAGKHIVEVFYRPRALVIGRTI